MNNYKSISKNLENKILSDRKNNTLPAFYCKDESSKRRKANTHDYGSVLRSPFIRDIDKILNCPYYNRYSDKTQVFSLYKNDDITRRSLHVQLVSRIARTIGKTLNLNLDLIEAIALGHDIGHTPFGHTGEKFIDELYRAKTGRRFNHNVHSVRVLDKIFPLNISLQTLDGILCHNGELELEKYQPQPLNDFDEFDKRVESCYFDSKNVLNLVPSTLEACVMRITDIIAYLGKDRQDAQRNKVRYELDFSDDGIGVINSEIINNLMVSIIQNSYNKPYIMLGKQTYQALNKAKKDNYNLIYLSDKNVKINDTLRQMASKIYEKLLSDLNALDKNSVVFTHHIDFINSSHYKRDIPYLDTEKNQIVVDFIASMTDDYFIELFKHLFPSSSLDIKYKGYFE